MTSGGGGVHVAFDAHGFGRRAEADDLRVKPDGNIHVIASRQKQEGVALGAELAVLLRGVNRVNLLLHLGSGRLWSKDQYIWPKVRRLRGDNRGCHRYGGNEPKASGEGV